MTDLPISQVHPNPDQPRKEFDEAKLRELAASIREHGLLQPITVRPNSNGYEIVMGERRYRAHVLAGLETIAAHVAEIDDTAMAEQAIIENLQRVDIGPLEEANAYQSLLNQGQTVETLAKRLGINQPWRITERTALLNLDPDYQALLKSKQITPSQATEMSRLGNRGQQSLFRAIKSGQCPTYGALRASATALCEVEAQVDIFGEDEAPAASEEDLRNASRFERKIDQVVQMLATTIRDNEVVAVKKVNPTNAATLADKMASMQKSLKTVELALRSASVQADFAGI